MNLSRLAAVLVVANFADGFKHLTMSPSFLERTSSNRGKTTGYIPDNFQNNLRSGYLSNSAGAPSNSAQSLSTTHVRGESASVSPFYATMTSQPKGSYSPFGSKPKTVSNNMGTSYLDTVSSGNGDNMYTSNNSPTNAIFGDDAGRIRNSYASSTSTAMGNSFPSYSPSTLGRGSFSSPSSGVGNDVGWSYKQNGEESHSADRYDSSNSASKNSYSPFGSKPKPVVNNFGSSYLDSVSGSAYSDSPVSSTHRQQTSLASSSTMSAGTNSHSPFGTETRFIANNMGSGYSDSFNEVHKASAYESYTTRRTNSGVSTVNSPPVNKGSYSPFGSKPKAVTNSVGSSYLNDVEGGTWSSLNSTPSLSLSDPATSGSPRTTATYSPFGSKPMAVDNNSGSNYLSSVSGSGWSPTYESARSPQSNSLGTDTSKVTKNSFSPFGSKPKVVVNNMGSSSYLNQVSDSVPQLTYNLFTQKGSNPFTASTLAPENNGSEARADYINSSNTRLSTPLQSNQFTSDTSTQSAKGAYTPFGSKPKTVANSMGSSYLNSFSQSQPPTPGKNERNQVASVPSTAQGKGGFSPFGSMRKDVESNMGSSYVNGVGQNSWSSTYGLPSPSLADPVASASPVVKRKGSYAPFGSKPKAVENSMGSNYLNGVGQNSWSSTYGLPSPSLADPVAPAVKGTGSYTPFGSKPKAVENNMGSSYLNGAGENTWSSTYGLPSPSLADPVAPASPATKGKGSYAPFGSKPKAVENSMGSSYLNGVENSWSSTYGLPSPSLADPVAPASPAVKGTGSYTPFGSKPKAAENNMGSSDLNGAGENSWSSTYGLPSPSLVDPVAPAVKGKGSYAPFGSKPKAVENNMGSSYLNGVGENSWSSTYGLPSPSLADPVAPASPAVKGKGSYTSFGSKPKAVENNMGSSYLNGVGQNSWSSTYGLPSPSLVDPVAPAVKGKGSYAPFGSKPKAVENNMGSSYLNGVGENSWSSTYGLPSPSLADPVAPASPAVKGTGSYTPLGSKPKAVENNMGSSYLNGVGESTWSSTYGSSSTSLADPVAPASPATKGNGSYAPFGSKPKAVESSVGSTYLNSFAEAPSTYGSSSYGSNSFASSVRSQTDENGSYSKIESTPANVAESSYNLLSQTGAQDRTSSFSSSKVNAAYQMNDLPSPPNPMPSGQRSYSPFGSKPKATKTVGGVGSTYLNSIGIGVSQATYGFSSPSDDMVPGSSSATGTGAYSEVGSKPNVVDNMRPSYLNNIGANPKGMYSTTLSPTDSLDQNPASVIDAEILSSARATYGWRQPNSYTGYGKKFGTVPYNNDVAYFDSEDDEDYFDSIGYDGSYSPVPKSAHYASPDTYWYPPSDPHAIWPPNPYSNISRFLSNPRAGLNPDNFLDAMIGSVRW